MSTTSAGADGAGAAAVAAAATGAPTTKINTRIWKRAIEPRLPTITKPGWVEVAGIGPMRVINDDPFWGQLRSWGKCNAIQIASRKNVGGAMTVICTDLTSGHAVMPVINDMINRGILPKPLTRSPPSILAWHFDGGPSKHELEMNKEYLDPIEYHELMESADERTANTSKQRIDLLTKLSKLDEGTIILTPAVL
jgi:hypothetical protein